MTYPEPEARPRSLILPLLLILLTCAAFGFITNSLHQRVAELQAQIDAQGADHQFLVICTGEAVQALNNNDVYLNNALQSVGKEVRRLGINQETLIIKNLELEPEVAE